MASDLLVEEITLIIIKVCLSRLLFLLLITIALKGFSDEGVFLDFETAWQRVLSYSPSLAAADAEICMREAEKQQVSTLPNPVAEIEAENLGVSHPNKETEPPQTTFSLSQTFELGGKRSARQTFASSLSLMAYWDAQIRRQEMRYALAIAFVELGVAQEKLKLAYEKKEIAERLLEVVERQIEGGKASLIQKKKAQIALTAEELAVKGAYSELELAKKSLAAMWGHPCPDFEGILFELFEEVPLPCQNCVLNGLFQTPDFTRAKERIVSASSNLALQKANRIPDVTLMAGYRVFNNSNQHGWVVGAAMPLPIFDKNQGNIKRAYAEISQAECQLEETERELKEKIFLAYERVENSFEESRLIKEQLLAEALEAFQFTQCGYQNGKFEYMELLEAQKFLFEVQEKYIEVLYNYHINKAELARLSGECICDCFE